MSPDTTTSITGRIVVGVDGSESSTAALRYAITLAELLKTGLTAVTTWQTPVTYGEGAILSNWSPEDDARTVASTAAHAAFPDGAPDWFETAVAHGPAAHALIEASAGASMLIVGSRGHGGFKGLLLGSVSSACAEYAKCPVLVYHAPRD